MAVAFSMILGGVEFSCCRYVVAYTLLAPERRMAMTRPCRGEEL